VTLRARSCPTCHSIGTPRVWAEETDNWVDVPPPTNISDRRCTDPWHIEVRDHEVTDDSKLTYAEQERAQDCGHDLEAFARQRAHLDQMTENAAAWMRETQRQAEERDRLADTVRRYQPVIDAAKAWRAMRLGTPTQPKPEAHALIQAVDGLDASPGDAETGHGGSPTFREAANFAGLLMLHSCGRGMAAFDRPPSPGGTCPTCGVAGRWRQLYLRDEPSAGSETGDGDG
jgi:hypothetical protein